MTSTSSNVRPGEQHRVLTDLIYKTGTRSNVE
jgi:hypothetical protein